MMACDPKSKIDYLLYIQEVGYMEMIENNFSWSE